MTTTNEHSLTLKQRQKRWLARTIFETLQLHHGNAGAAAAELGIHRNTMSRLILDVGISRHHIEAMRKPYIGKGDIYRTDDQASSQRRNNG